jgi:hypothetical protein
MASVALTGLMIHETAVAGGRFIAVGLRPVNGTLGLYVIMRTTAGAASAQVFSLTTDPNGQPITGPVYLRMERSADLKTVAIYWSLTEVGWLLLTTQTIAMNASVHYGPFSSSAQAGVDILSVVEEVAISNTGSLQSVVSATSPVSIALRAVDAVGNMSAVTSFVQGIPKAATPVGGQIKYDVGHFANFNTTMFRGDTLTRVKSEIDSIGAYDLVLGYQAAITMACLEPVKGETDTSTTYPSGYASGKTVIRQLLDYMRTSFRKPKRLYVKLQVGAYTSTHAGASDYSIVPQYIQTDSAYGAAGYKVAGVTTNLPAQHGWWGGDGNGNTYSMCLQRTAVMARVIKLVQALGDEFDSDPYFQGINFEENSFCVGAVQNNGCPDWSSTNFEANADTLLSSITSHWPTTNVLYENTYCSVVNQSQQRAAYMAAHRIAFSATDTLGQTYVNAHTGLPFSWGAQIYCGQTGGGTLPAVNYRDQNYPAMFEVQATDMGAYGQFAGGYTKEDILACLKQTIKAKIAFWVVLTGAQSSYSGLKANSVWSFMGPFLNDPANALTNTSYPKGYP